MDIKKNNYSRIITESVLIDSSSETFSLTTSFVPDLVEYQIIATAPYNHGANNSNAILPQFATTEAGLVNYSLYGSNIIQLDVPDLKPFPVCSFNNSVNPIFRIDNTGAQTFNGEHSFRLVNLTSSGNSATKITEGAVTLIITFYKF